MDVPRFPPILSSCCLSVGYPSDPRSRRQQRQPARTLPPKTRAAKLLVAWKGAHVGDDIGNIVRRQRTFEGWHVAAFAVGRTAFGNDAGHVAIVEQLGVALSVEGAHMGHEIFAAAATVGTVAARTVTLEERLTALGVCSRDRCRGKEQANGGVLDDAPPTPFAFFRASHLIDPLSCLRRCRSSCTLSISEIVPWLWLLVCERAAKRGDDSLASLQTRSKLCRAPQPRPASCRVSQCRLTPLALQALRAVPLSPCRLGARLPGVERS